MPPRFQIFASSSEARTATLQGLLIAALVITGLYVAREVLLPLALAILLSFVLTPASRRSRRNRALSMRSPGRFSGSHLPCRACP